MTNRAFVLTLTLGMLTVFVHAIPATAAPPPSAHWISSTATRPWAAQPDLPLLDRDFRASETITVDTGTQFQTIEGWGGCFNERGWRAMQVLAPEERDRLMRSMFDPTDGLKLNLCRTPIAASDYAIDLYSYDETPGDLEMSHFSIDRDRQLLIPYIKAAMALQPALKLWAVPWSPPSWMKDSGKLTGGHIKTDPATMNALALYFAKYIQAYRAEGLPLYMVMPQNEPCYSTNYTSCEWSGAEMGIFVRDYLGPLFKQQNLDCQIYLGTIARTDKKWNYDYWLGSAMSDPVTRAYVTGIGCQWGGDPIMRQAHEKFPSLKLMQTEAECGKTNTNDFAFATARFAQMIRYFDSGAESFMIWNLVLDETGLSTAGWAQCSPIVVNQKTKEVVYTPYFYAYKHASNFVAPGAHRVAVTSNGPKCLAFENPDGRVVVVVENEVNKPRPVTINYNREVFACELPAESFNTFVLDKATGQ